MATIVICEALAGMLLDEVSNKTMGKREDPLYDDRAWQAETMAKIRAEVKERVKPVGKSSEPLTNDNFVNAEKELLKMERNAATYEEWGRMWRRVDITVVSL
jgi:hypothetical protein